jgi:hypothetical protein
MNISARHKLSVLQKSNFAPVMNSGEFKYQLNCYRPGSEKSDLYKVSFVFFRVKPDRALKVRKMEHLVLNGSKDLQSAKYIT